MRNRTELAAVVVPVKNLDRGFGEVAEEEGYVLVKLEEVQAALFTRHEWTSATQRADDNPEDVLDLEVGPNDWWDDLMGI